MYGIGKHSVLERFSGRIDELVDEELATLFHVLPNCTFAHAQEHGSLFGLTSTEVSNSS